MYSMHGEVVGESTELSVFNLGNPARSGSMRHMGHPAQHEPVGGPIWCVKGEKEDHLMGSQARHKGG